MITVHFLLELCQDPPGDLDFSPSDLELVSRATLAYNVKFLRPFILE